MTIEEIIDYLILLQNENIGLENIVQFLSSESYDTPKDVKNELDFYIDNIDEFFE